MEVVIIFTTTLEEDFLPSAAKGQKAGDRIFSCVCVHSSAQEPQEGFY